MVPAAGATEHGTFGDDADVAGGNEMQPFRGLGANDLPLNFAVGTCGLLDLDAVVEGWNVLADLPATLGALGAAALARRAEPGLGSLLVAGFTGLRILRLPSFFARARSVQ